MPIYESISILKSSLSDEEIQKTISKLEGIAKKGGELIATENWGKKKLAYDIQKEKRGVYILLRFRGDGKNIPELERAYGYDDNIIKFLTVKLGKQAAIQAEKPPVKAGSSQGQNPGMAVSSDIRKASGSQATSPGEA
ncbi:MAG: 30S ribosomal protein S6 [Nitrospirae bacterium]|nr:30S ribosomal protein S6 [Nitrospirota bacterium]